MMSSLYLIVIVAPLLCMMLVVNVEVLELVVDVLDVHWWWCDVGSIPLDVELWEAPHDVLLLQEIKRSKMWRRRCWWWRWMHRCWRWWRLRSASKHSTDVTDVWWCPWHDVLQEVNCRMCKFLEVLEVAPGFGCPVQLMYSFASWLDVRWQGNDVEKGEESCDNDACLWSMFSCRCCNWCLRCLWCLFYAADVGEGDLALLLDVSSPPSPSSPPRSDDDDLWCSLVFFPRPLFSYIIPAFWANKWQLHSSWCGYSSMHKWKPMKRRAIRPPPPQKNRTDPIKFAKTLGWGPCDTCWNGEMFKSNLMDYIQDWEKVSHANNSLHKPNTCKKNPWKGSVGPKHWKDPIRFANGLEWGPWDTHTEMLKLMN